jgi:hypothetical protein
MEGVMDYKEKRAEIIKRNFSGVGLLIITVLGLFGIFIMFISGVFAVSSFEELYDCIYYSGFEIIIGLFFIFVCVYCYITYIVNIIFKPWNDVVYLYKGKDYNFFIDKRGRKIKYGDNTDLIENKYYQVLRTRDCIYYIYNETHGDWTPKFKKSFWLTWYSPVGLWEDIFLLPIVYVIFIPGFLSILMSEGFNKIYGIIWCVFPGYLIGYDIYFKLKNK